MRLAIDPPHWTPQQIDAMDPDFLSELETAMSARIEHRKKEAEKQKRKNKNNKRR